MGTGVGRCRAGCIAGITAVVIVFIRRGCCQDKGGYRERVGLRLAALTDWVYDVLIDKRAVG
jgi:hypothetical protein